MKIAISVKGRFHAFFLAHELQKASLLSQLVTSYPVLKAQEYGIDQQYITSLIANEIAERLTRKLPISFLKSHKANYFFQEIFDKRAARKIQKTSDVFIGWSSSALHTLKKLHFFPIKTILENGSTHALFQKEILEEEFALHGMQYFSNKAIIEKQLEEYSLANYISTPSCFTKNSFLQKNIPEKKIIQVPYGVDTEKFYPLQKPDTVFRIIFCGNAGLRKGLQYLLQAFYELKLPHSELYIIGPIAEELQLFVKKYSADNIIYAGCFAENKLVYEYAKGSVFCLPSIEEGLALVLPQAMACGLPVICTANTGSEDIIQSEKEGFIIPIRDIDALKEKIILLYRHPELQLEMGKRAHHTITEKFTWAHYGKKMIAALLSLRP